jgi:predicted nucleic-acid-binding protein
MIGVDTNVLLRAVMLDDAGQAGRAQDVLVRCSAAEPALINSVVLAEFVWSLRSYYKMPRAEIAEILRDMVASEAYAFTEREAVLDALHDYENGIGGFTDRLIAESNFRHGGEPTLTFDAEAARRPPFAPVP